MTQCADIEQGSFVCELSEQGRFLKEEPIQPCSFSRQANIIPEQSFACVQARGEVDGFYWTASSFLTCFSAMNKQQHAEQVQISLTAKGRATFVSVSCIQPDLSTFERVQIPKADLGRKLGYDECLDVITFVNQQAQDNPESETLAEQADPEDVPFEVPAEKLDNLIEEIQQPKKRRRKSAVKDAEAAVR